MSKSKQVTGRRGDKKNTLSSITKEVLGETLFTLIKQLEKREYTSEYVLAEELNRDINSTRHLLYELLKHNLLSFKKEKDKIRGWYIYYWKFHNERLIDFIIKRLKEKKQRYLDKMELEKDHTYFVCPNKCVKLTFDQALNFNFKCPECGANLIENNKEDEIKRIEQIVNRTESKIKEMQKIKVLNEKTIEIEKTKKNAKAKTTKKRREKGKQKRIIKRKRKTKKRQKKVMKKRKTKAVKSKVKTAGLKKRKKVKKLKKKRRKRKKKRPAKKQIKEKSKKKINRNKSKRKGIKTKNHKIKIKKAIVKRTKQKKNKHQRTGHITPKRVRTKKKKSILSKIMRRIKEL